MFKLSERSLQRLQGVHCDLLAVVHFAIEISTVDFGIPADGGVRTAARQRQLQKAGASQTLNSRHLTGHAFDIYAYVDGAASWQREHVIAVHLAITEAARQLHVPLRWGGDWNGDGKVGPNDNDLVHHELPEGQYGHSMLSKSEQARTFLAMVTL